jgi:hypothetical protein
MVLYGTHPCVAEVPGKHAVKTAAKPVPVTLPISASHLIRKPTDDFVKFPQQFMWTQVMTATIAIS